MKHTMTQKITVFDTKFRKHLAHYIMQCILATLTLLAVLLFLDVLTETAIIAALGASAFIIFTMPTMYSSDPRRLLGGYTVGLVTGLIFSLLSAYITSITVLFTPQSAYIFFGSIAVGIAIFIMAITNTEHAPAAGIALGLVINTWNYTTIMFIIAAILWMAGIRKLLQPLLIDLTSPKQLTQTAVQKNNSKKP